MLITQKAIDNLRKFPLQEFDDKEAEKYNYCTNITVYGMEDGISLRTVPQAKELVCTPPKNSLIFLHNHPRNSIFSKVD